MLYRYAEAAFDFDRPFRYMYLVCDSVTVECQTQNRKYSGHRQFAFAQACLLLHAAVLHASTAISSASDLTF